MERSCINRNNYSYTFGLGILNWNYTTWCYCFRAHFRSFRFYISCYCRTC